MAVLHLLVGWMCGSYASGRGAGSGRGASDYGARVPARVVVFGPHPLLSVTLERRGEADEVHFHAGGQGVWVARNAAELGARPVLCGLVGGEAGAPLQAVLDRLPFERRLVRTSGPSGTYVQDRRSGERVALAAALATPPSRHEVDELFSLTAAAALDADVLAVCNPFPGDALPLELFGDLVQDVRANGTPVLVDLSTPRLDRALEGRPDLVKLNDWELAEYVVGPVGEPEQLRAAAGRLLDAGAQAVLVTRGERSAWAFRADGAWEVTPPRFDRGHREGCGDTMFGALAAVWLDEPWEERLRTGAAAGAAAFLRHGLGSVTRDVVEELRPSVRVERRDPGQ
jgi:1-phosphofructokinase